MEVKRATPREQDKRQPSGPPYNVGGGSWRGGRGGGNFGAGGGGRGEWSKNTLPYIGSS